MDQDDLSMSVIKYLIAVVGGWFAVEALSRVMWWLWHR